MASVLFVVSGSDHWTLADGTKHSTGYWPEELAVPHRVLREAGIQVDFATPGGVAPTADEAGFAPAMNGDSEERAQEMRDYIAGIEAELSSPLDLDEVDPAKYDAVFVPGGHGPMEDLPGSASLSTLLQAMHTAEKPIAAVCHGVAGLLAAPADGDSWPFKGYRMTGFSNAGDELLGFTEEKTNWLLESRLRANGGEYSAAEGPFDSHVVVDRNLYTGQNPASSGPLADELVKTLD